MPNVRYSSRSQSSVYSYSEELGHVIFNNRRNKLLYMDLSHRKKSGFILVNMGFHKFKHRHAKHALEFGKSIFRFKSQE
jgi:hypothetical protein